MEQEDRVCVCVCGRKKEIGRNSEYKYTERESNPHMVEAVRVNVFTIEKWFCGFVVSSLWTFMATSRLRDSLRKGRKKQTEQPSKNKVYAWTLCNWTSQL